MSQKLSGGQSLVKSLSGHGVDRLFCVAGESYLAAMDAFVDHSEIDVVTCRQEGGAAFMAEAYGKLTGKPGICFVTRGPGACNASIGVHTAKQDSTPMILFIGQVASDQMDREAFQEIDYRKMFGDVAKWVAQIDRADRIPEYVRRAFQVATSGRPGPVVLALPEDMLRDAVDQLDLPAYETAQPHPAQDDIEALQGMLSKAERPLAIVGGSGWSAEACADFEDFANAAHLPVATAFRRQDIFNNRSSCYVGELGTGPNPALIEKVKDADLLLVIGARLCEITTQGYTVPKPPKNQQTLIHIYPEAEELGRVYTPDLAVLSYPSHIVASLAGGFSIDGRSWADWKESLRNIYQQWSNIDLGRAGDIQGTDMNTVFDTIIQTIPDDAIITTDAGNFSGWAQRYIPYGRPGRLLAPTSGAMGYAVPSAVAASLTYPDRLVIGMAGDGGFMMTGQELATIVHHGAKPVILVFNNGMYGTIRMHQERDYPGRVSGTALTNPNFSALAQAYGIKGYQVTETAAFKTVWQSALASGEAALIEVVMDPNQLTTRSFS